MHVSKKKKGLTDLDGLPKQCEEGVADKTTGEEDEDADSTIGEEAEDSSDGEESEEGSPFDPYKLGSEVIVFDPSEGNRDGYGSDDTDYEGEQRDVYLKYRRQYRESEGFDFDDYPKQTEGELFLGVARHVDFEDEDGFYTKGCREALAYAVQEQNKKGGNLRPLEIIKANGESIGLYHITFRAEDTKRLGEIKVYQTRVFYSLVPDCDHNEVFIFRLKEDDKAN
ncbi:uncharacterized protein LOC110625729 isoform X2 [Manihot esculenta]|uniref:uncharacterized protein LOC110625729 isoform X2 n=1 Tax=Manihot esculenta TaxID=3983 RepID=UPI001CC332D2|nr:uncharacterized protein LOC110625729 isoform X2 [Manihot esculenta]